jgi:hypothetical protein
MQPIYHSFLTVPILSLINGLIFLSGLYFFGYYLQKIFKIEDVISKVSNTNYQNILISTNFLLIILYPICLYIPNSNVILKIVSIIIFIFGIINIICNFNFLKKIKKLINKSNKLFLNIDFLLYFLLIFGLILLSFAPVTNADSLDYHLFTAKHLLQHGSYPNYLTNFHATRLSGSGEIMIALGLFVGSEQFGSVLQVSGLISLLGVLRKIKAPYIFYVILLSSPVIIFFSSSVKPQLFSICSVAFVFSLIFFDKFKKKIFLDNFEKKKIILSVIVLFASTQVKFSFILSAFLLTLFLFIYNFKKEKLKKILKIILISYFFIIFPSIIWRFLNFGGNFFELLYSPFSTSSYGLDFFKMYLVNLNANHFAWFLVPLDIEKLTQSLGIGSIMIFYLFKLENKKQNYHLAILIFIFFIISYFFGQFSARFFLEPYVWLIIYLSKFYQSFKINYFYKMLLRVQAGIIIIMIFFGVFTLTKGVISSELRDKVLEKYASGYTFFKWVNHNLKNNTEPLMSFNRSISFSKNFAISRDHLFYVNPAKDEAKNYLDEIKKIRPKYLVVSSQNITYTKYKNCILRLYKTEKNIDHMAVRNPLISSNKKYDIFIYEISVDLMPKCINPDKVDSYSRD